MEKKIILSAIPILFFCCSVKTSETTQADTIPSLDSSNLQIPGLEEEILEDDQVFDLYQNISERFAQKDKPAAKKLISENKERLIAFEKTQFVRLPPGTFLYQFSDDPDMVKFLLQEGFDPNTGSFFQGEEGSSSIEYPSTCDRDIARLLIEAGSLYAIDKLMKCAVNEKDVAQVRSLLRQGGDPLLAIPLACEIHDRDLLNDLIEEGANINEALYWSVQNEDIEVVKELMEKGAKLGRSELEPWGMPSILVSKNEELRSMVVGVSNGAIFSELHGGEGYCDGSYLITASKEGDSKTVEFMLKAGANPNQFCWEDPDGNFECSRVSALGAAESSGNEEVVELLKKYSATKPEKCL